MHDGEAEVDGLAWLMTDLDDLQPSIRQRANNDRLSRDKNDGAYLVGKDRGTKKKKLSGGRKEGVSRTG